MDPHSAAGIVLLGLLPVDRERASRPPSNLPWSKWADWASGMSEIRILILEPLDYSQRAFSVYQDLGQVDVGPLDREDLLARIGGYDVLVVRLSHQIDAEVIESARKLQAIVTPTTGLDHIDVEVADGAGVTVLSLRDQKEFLRTVRSSAEHTWALLLALTRRVPWAFQDVIDGRWDRDRFRGHDLAGRTLGLVGVGRIGEMVAGMAMTFGMRVRGYDPHRSGWVDGVERAQQLEELADTVDILSVHLHLDEDTHGLLDFELLSRLRRGSFLVNTARGEVIVEDDLIRLLEFGHLAGAAVDVVSGERREGSSRLIAYAQRSDNLIITPHIAGATIEAMERTEFHMAQLLREHMEELR